MKDVNAPTSVEQAISGRSYKIDELQMRVAAATNEIHAAFFDGKSDSTEELIKAAWYAMNEFEQRGHHPHKRWSSTNLRGNIHLAAEEFDKALSLHLTALELAAEKRPDDDATDAARRTAISSFNLGRCYMRLGDFATASQHFSTAQAILPIFGNRFCFALAICRAGDKSLSAQIVHQIRSDFANAPYELKHQFAVLCRYDRILQGFNEIPEAVALLEEAAEYLEEVRQ